MTPAQARYRVHLGIAVLFLFVDICAGQERPPIAKKERSKATEKIPPPTEKDHKEFEDRRSLHHISPSINVEDPEQRGLHCKVEVARSTHDEDAIIDRLLDHHDNMALGEVAGIRESRQTGKKRKNKKKTKKKKKSNKTNKKKNTKKTPVANLMDLDLMGSDHPAQKLRSGEATNEDSCKDVRNVPSSLRNAAVMYSPINSFYSKYTEAYGIPIVGSRHCTDAGLKRACYTVRAMFASHYNVRNAYYKLYGRVALIADNEEQTSLYEYRTWDSAHWDNRVRGLGASITIPMCSAGDDNQRCKVGERYFDQDILIHELAHGVHTLASEYVIPTFQKRLTDAYKKNVVGKKKWHKTYAATNINEYFAVASQFYFNSFRGLSYEDLGISDQSSLRRYDPDITALLDEVYSCYQYSNSFIHRCDWKSCKLSDFTLEEPASKHGKSDCKVIKQSTNRDSAARCAIFTCYHLGNAFNYRPGHCIVLDCKVVRGKIDPDISQNMGRPGFDIYTTRKTLKMDLKKELSQKMKKSCTQRGTSSCNVSRKEKRKIKVVTDKYDCENIGGCYESNSCFYPTQRATNRFMLCVELLMNGECSRNWPFMYRTCGTACGVCKKLEKFSEQKLLNYCQDENEYCATWEKGGQCKVNPTYMKRTCPASCKECKIPKEPK